MGLFVVHLYDREFGYVGANYYNVAFDGKTPSEIKKECVSELYGYGFNCPRVILVRLI